MTDKKALIEKVYAAFNQRHIDGALLLMSEDVRWPKASEGGCVVGKEEIRAYWTRQWAEFDPHVEPVEITEIADEKAEVRVRQVVKSVGGELLFDGEVRHVYTIAAGLIEAMELKGSGGEAPSSAFAKHSPNAAVGYVPAQK